MKNKRLKAIEIVHPEMIYILIGEKMNITQQITSFNSFTLIKKSFSFCLSYCGANPLKTWSYSCSYFISNLFLYLNNKEKIIIQPILYTVYIIRLCYVHLFYNTKFILYTFILYKYMNNIYYRIYIILNYFHSKWGR